MSRHRWRVPAFAAGALLAGCSGHAPPPPEPQALRADLETVAHARVLFGRQSVGRNVLAGLAQLAEDNGVALRIQEIDGEPPDGRPGLFHARIGVNGDPAGKIDAFVQLLERPARPRYDAALMELCYLDFGSEARRPVTPAALVARYLAAVRSLAARRPDVRLVHVTAPLRAEPPGWKSRLKRLLGRETEEDADNVLRNDYNAQLVSAVAGAPLFDLALVESTRPDGRTSEFRRSGRAVRTLAPEYTTDGGHLNPGGSRRAAIALVQALARALRESQAVDLGRL